jgi:TolC family type I secretion outer membrane protein
MPPRTAAPLAAAILVLAPLAGADVVRAQEGEPGATTAEPRRVTVDEAVRIALRNNPDRTRSAAGIEQARADRLDAYGDFLPDVNLGYGFSDASTGRLDPTGQSITTTSYTVQLGASVELFDGFRRFNQVDAARENLQAERERHRSNRYEVILSAKRAFYNAVATRELVEVEEDRVQRQRDQLDFVRGQVDVGQANRSDLLRSRVELNNARLDLVNAENDARAATFELARALGTSRRVEPVEEAGLAVDSLPIRRGELMRRALEDGPSVRSARAALEAARAEVGSSRSLFLPSLSLQGGWAWQNTEFPPGNRSWSISLQGSLPVFDGFQRESSMSRSRARADAAESDVQAAELEIRADVDDAYSQVQSARAAVELARQTVELAREDLEVTRERFRLGLATILDLQSAQITLREAEADLVQRRFDFQVGVARLESLVGADLEVDGSGGDPAAAPGDGRR